MRSLPPEAELLQPRGRTVELSEPGVPRHHQPQETMLRLPRRLSSVPRHFSSLPAKRVAIVYGTFDCGKSAEDAQILLDYVQQQHPDLKLDVSVSSGDEFDFDSLTQVSHLVLSTSSWFGHPPLGLRDVAHQLLLTAETAPGCLSHLQHAVWGNGDERWFKTFMNVPRYMDALLERSGSRRFYARGECGEPHAPARVSDCQVVDWAPGMWSALLSDAPPEEPSVAWDALWEHEPSPRHQEMTQWGLRELVSRHGNLDGPPSKLAKPDDEYWGMIKEVQAEIDDRRARLEARRRRAEEERLRQPP